MGQAAAEVIGGAVPREVREDLRFSGETAKRAGVQDARSVACEWSAVGVREFAVDPLRQRSVVPYRNAGRQQISTAWSRLSSHALVTFGYTASGRSNARDGDGNRPMASGGNKAGRARFRSCENTCAQSLTARGAGCYKLLMQFAMDNILGRGDNPAGNSKGPHSCWACGPAVIFSRLDRRDV